MGMKESEIGMIPEEWSVQSFADIFRILNNNTFSRAELNYVSGRFKNIHYGDVLILFPEVLDCTRDDVPYINDGVRISGSAQPLQDGDIVMADTAEDETVGRVTEVTNTSEKPVMAGLHTVPCRVKSGEFAAKWLGYYMNSHIYHDQLLPYIHGTKVSSVSKGSLGSTTILVPSTDEQKKIVSALSDIDSLLLNLQKLISKEKNIRQSCMQHMFPRNGQQVPEWRFPEFSGAWEQRKAKDLCSIGTGKSITQDQIEDGEYPFFIRSDIPVRSNKYLYDCEAVITIGDGNIGKVFHYVNGKFDLHQRCYKMADFEDIWGKYFYYYFSAKFYDRAMKMTAKATVDSVRLEMISEMDIQKPKEIAEQKQIAEFFTHLDTLITLHQRKLDKYKNIKQGMMEELLTGKVRLV